MKRCPFCAEEIQDNAIKCRYCGEILMKDALGGGQSQLVSGEDKSVSQPRDTLSGETKEFPEGYFVSNRYEIIRELGRGGMGIVYLANDKVLGITVALKILPKLLSSSPKAINKLKEEAKITMTLSHPNILHIYNFEEQKDDYFIIMEYVDGKTLEKLIGEKGRLSLDELLPIAEQVANGLDYAHSKKVLHRDIKPANILIDREGMVRVADFGIARQVKDSMTRITGQETSGTLLYMSPEQMVGGKINHRSDIYSFSAVVYEALSGEPPFTTGHIAEQIRSVKPENLSDVPEYVNRAIQRGLAKTPEERFNLCKELVNALKNLEADIVLPKTPKVEIVSSDIGKPYAERKNYIEDLGGGVKLEMVWIPAGTFEMGSPSSEEGRFNNQSPVHTVELDGFWMGKFEVTQAQWQSFMNNNPSYFKGDNLPVEQVSWDDAMEFCEKLSDKTGKKYTLPTEAQWEYACRAGSKSRFCFGDSDSSLGDYAWYSANSYFWTHPVGQKNPNAWGLYDMYGNVFEWCLDYYDENYYSKSPSKNPVNMNSSSYRVLRGGSSFNNPEYCRSAYRGLGKPDYRNLSFGFRVVRIL